MKNTSTLKFKIVVTISLVLASAFLLSNFALPKTALAQTATGTCNNYPAGPYLPGKDPTTSKENCEAAGGIWNATAAPGANVVLTPAKDLAAQASPSACKTYGNDIAYVFGNQTPGNPNFKTVYYAGGFLGSGKGCYIVPGYFHVGSDGIDADNAYFNQPTGAQEIQTQIQQGRGISSTTVTSAVAQNLKDQNDASLPSKVVGKILEVIIGIFTVVVAWVTAIAGGIFAYTVAEIVKVQSLPPIVNVGWTVVRDIANMLFILVLIVISLGTILRIEEYDYKHLLKDVIIMALLVNFSKEIALVLMNATSVIVRMFSIDGSSIKNIFVFHIGVWRSFQEGMPNGWMAGLADSLLAFGFALISLFVFVALTGMFVVRLVGIYVLIVISPMAYVLNILPTTKNYAQEWWKHFIKYLIWAPVALFFIKLTALAAEGGLGDIGDPSNSAFRYVILCGFMMAAVMVAQQAGMVGGQQVTDWAKKGTLGSAAWLGKRGLGFAGRYYNEWTGKLLESHEGKKPPGLGKKFAFALLNPVAFGRGWGARSEELAEMHKKLAAAGGREVAEQFLTTDIFKLENLYAPWRLGKNVKGAIEKGGSLRIPYRQFVERAEENEFLKQYQEMRKESLMNAAVEVEGMTGHEGEVRKQAIVKAAAAQGYLDDLLRMKQFANKYADADGTVYSAEVLNRFLYGYLGHGEQAMRFMAEDMENLGKQTKHYEYLGHAYFDPDSGAFKNGMEESGVEDKVTRGGQERKIRRLKNIWQAGYSSGELAKIGGRQRAEIAPHNLVPLRAEIDETTGEFKEQGKELRDMTFGRASGEIDEFTAAILTKVADEATLRDIHFSQARTKDWVLSGDVDQNTGEIMVANDGELRKIQALWKQAPEYVKAMYAQHTGLQRAQISGLRISLYNRDPQGNVTGKHFTDIGDYDPMKLPIAVKATEEVVDNPSFQLSEDIQKKLRLVIEPEIQEATLGNINKRQLATNITHKIQDLNLKMPTGFDMNIFIDDIYKKLKVNVDARYNPTSVIKEIDSRLNARSGGHIKLNVTQMNAMSGAVSTAVGEAYQYAAENGIKLSQRENAGVLRDRINDHLQGISDLPPLDPSDIDIFVQHARPTK